MPRLYNWYFREYISRDGTTKMIAKGVVTGHERLLDATFIHTSTVKSVEVYGDDVIIQTKNTRYECSMKEANYNKAEITKKVIPNLDTYEEKYANQDKNLVPFSGSDDETLMIIGNNREYYFDSLYAKRGEKEIYIDYPHVHVGLVQDSVLVMEDDYGDDAIDYRYFPYKGRHIEFYSANPERKLYIKNCGDMEMYVSFHGDKYKIEAGETKLLMEENAEKNPPKLSHIDLHDITGRTDEDLEKAIERLKDLSKKN